MPSTNKATTSAASSNPHSSSASLTLPKEVAHEHHINRSESATSSSSIPSYSPSSLSPKEPVYEIDSSASQDGDSVSYSPSSITLSPSRAPPSQRIFPQPLVINSTSLHSNPSTQSVDMNSVLGAPGPARNLVEALIPDQISILVSCDSESSSQIIRNDLAHRVILKCNLTITVPDSVPNAAISNLENYLHSFQGKEDISSAVRTQLSKGLQ
jgi:hypothetical protein